MSELKRLTWNACKFLTVEPLFSGTGISKSGNWERNYGHGRTEMTTNKIVKEQHFTW